jgi:hypothetical protein
MLFRTGVPLSVAAALELQGGLLARSSVLGFTMFFYLVTLAVETRLSVRLVRDRSGQAKFAA